MNTPAQHGLRAQMAPRSLHLRHSMRTHIVLLRFCAISFSTAVLDNAVFYVAFHAWGSILGAQAVGRVISVSFNYRFVRRTVFCSNQGHNALLPRYLALVVVNALLSYGGIRLLSAFTPLGVIASKIVAETLLFVVNFAVQRAFIFNRSTISVTPPEPSTGL